MSTEGKGSSYAEPAVNRRDESNLPFVENPHTEGEGGDGSYDKESGVPGGILPQSIPSDTYDTTGMAAQFYAPQAHRYFPETSSGGGGNVLPALGPSGYSQSGGFDQGVPLYPHSSSFMHQGIPRMGGKPFSGNGTDDIPNSPIMQSYQSPQFPTVAQGTAFAAPPQMDSSSRMPMLPPYPSPQSYTPPPYGYGSSGSGYPGTMGANVQDISTLLPSPHMYTQSAGSEMQPGHYDTNTGSSHAVSQLLPSSAIGLGGSRSAYAASQLSAGSYVRMGMYSGLQPSYSFGYGGEQYQRAPRGNQGGGDGRGGRGQYRGPRGGGGPSFPNKPGPPILNPGNSKGPDGANLFIFHIPNDFSNKDMHDLFSEHGNVLSVRIMVEPETGRSRGFGFVSYDSAESAASAIKHLNGYAIKGKRLKVQHKQIRKSDRFRSNAGVDEGYVNYPPRDDDSPSGQEAGFLSDEYDEGEECNYDDAAGGHFNPLEANRYPEGEGGIPLLAQEVPGTIGDVMSSVTPEDKANDEGTAVSPLANLNSLEKALPELSK